MKYFQCELSNQGSKMIAWIEDKGAVEGKRVRLTDSDNPDVFWSVDKVYVPGMERDSFKQMQDFHRKWHNNI